LRRRKDNFAAGEKNNFLNSGSKGIGI